MAGAYLHYSRVRHYLTHAHTLYVCTEGLRRLTLFQGDRADRYGIVVDKDKIMTGYFPRKVRVLKVCVLYLFCLAPVAVIVATTLYICFYKHTYIHTYMCYTHIYMYMYIHVYVYASVYIC